MGIKDRADNLINSKIEKLQRQLEQEGNYIKSLEGIVDGETIAKVISSTKIELMTYQYIKSRI